MRNRICFFPIFAFPNISPSVIQIPRLSHVYLVENLEVQRCCSNCKIIFNWRIKEITLIIHVCFFSSKMSQKSKKIITIQVKDEIFFHLLSWKNYRYTVSSYLTIAGYNSCVSSGWKNSRVNPAWRGIVRRWYNRVTLLHISLSFIGGWITPGSLSFLFLE